MNTPEEQWPQISEARAMLSAPLSKLERDALVEFTGEDHCDSCRLSRDGNLCHSCAVRLRQEGTMRNLETQLSTQTERIATLEAENDTLRTALIDSQRYGQSEIDRLKFLLAALGETVANRIPESPT